MNPTKCYAMAIPLATKYKVLHDYVLHGAPLPVVNQYKYLGVILLHIKFHGIPMCLLSLQRLVKPYVF